MKWTNPGHQLDELGQRYLKIENLLIYGTDGIALDAVNFINWLGVAEDFCIANTIDFNDTLKNPRFSPENTIVVLTNPEQADIAATIKNLGYNHIFYLSPAHNRRDNFIQNFACIWLMYKHGKLLSHWTNFLTTSRCNLNCYKCLNFYSFIDNPKDVTFDEFKYHIDIMFSKFDYLYSLHFTGGEPLLVEELPKFIMYLADNYKNRIYDFFVITNATIMPSVELIDSMRLIDGHFHLDDYSDTVLSSKVVQIQSFLDNHGMKYVTNKPSYWYDLGI